MLATDCWDRSGLPVDEFVKDTAQITGFGVNDNHSDSFSRTQSRRELGSPSAFLSGSGSSAVQVSQRRDSQQMGYRLLETKVLILTQLR